MSWTIAPMWSAARNRCVAFIAVGSTLYTIDLSTGLATPVGQIGIDNSQFLVTGLSVAPVQGPGGGGPNGAPVPAAAVMAPLAAAIAGAWSRRWRRRRD